MSVRGGDETVLLVENDIAVRDILNDFLTRLGYHVLNASRASEAHELLAEAMQVDLLITDIVLAGECSGIKLANEARLTHPTLPVLVISGFAESTITGTLSNTARVGWLAKPFSRQSVARHLRELLDA
nr:response regulator [Pararhodobacter sp. SW119]